MTGFRCALGFLTIIPLTREGDGFGENMLRWFPAAGLVIGALWVLFDWGAGLVFQPALRSILDVLFLVILTGGLHLDGLADTFDGLLSHRPTERKLEIMKDSRLGTWGALALVAALAVKAAALAEIIASGKASLILLLAPCYGRTAMLAVMDSLPYGRGREGLASNLLVGQNRRKWVPAAVITGLAAFITGPIGFVALNLVFALVLYLLVLWYRRSLGAVTGDMTGASGEIIETALLVAMAAVL